MHVERDVALTGEAAFGATGADEGGVRSGLFVIQVPLRAGAVVDVRLINKLPLVTPWFLVAPVIPVLVHYLVLWR
ncbi:transcriptional regulator [Nocardioides sp. NPDC058538]|uniref:transcriptional regulator n=1 Tax=Nocardioides sp. NPDC058538 TaxID=3346542 RepID=UPI0036592216